MEIFQFVANMTNVPRTEANTGGVTYSPCSHSMMDHCVSLTLGLDGNISICYYCDNVPNKEANTGGVTYSPRTHNRMDQCVSLTHGLDSNISICGKCVKYSQEGSKLKMCEFQCWISSHLIEIRISNF